ncbi:hypothetical protein ACIQMP_07925 [Streptomyces sp. NPDC091385]|uniref:hypothetical protein n=1 Tax=Streptomyces sp. NPDC091385 TaxID=3365997 RepID=UPI00380F1863
MTSRQPLAVGQIIHGFAYGAFGRDHYHCVRIEAVGPDWIIARDPDPDALWTGPSFTAGRRLLELCQQARDEPCTQDDPCPARTAATSLTSPSDAGPMVGVGMPAALHLDAFGREVDAAFGHLPYLVGSAAVSKSWRDVDVRLILPDEEFDALFPTGARPAHQDGRWSLFCAAISELGRQRTGLPIDFQIQRMTFANDRYPRPKVRLALGIHDRNGQ